MQHLDSLQTQTLERDIKYDLPESYYVESSTPLTREDLLTCLNKHYKYLSDKIRLNANKKLHLSLRKVDVEDIMGDVVVATLKQFDAGKSEFYSLGKFVGYVLVAGWRTVTAENKKKVRKVEAREENGFDSWQPVHAGLEEVAELPSVPRASRGSLDLRDDFAATIWQNLWEHLGNKVLDGTLNFRDVAIYKHYMLHKYLIVAPGSEKPHFTIDEMVAQKEFSRKQINTAKKIVKQHVEAYVKQMKMPEDVNYEDEAEDIFGY